MLSGGDGTVSGSGSTEALPPAPEPMSKEDRLRAKNRRAQAKYRQRKQNEKEQLYKESVEMAAAVRKIEAEKAFLESQVQALSSELHDTQLTAPLPHPTASQECEEEHIYEPINGYQNLEPLKKPGILLKAIFDIPRKYTHEEAMALTLKDHLDIRKEIALKAGQLLVKNPERDLSSPEGQKLKNPDLLAQLIRAKAVEPVELEDEPPASLWATALKRLELTQEQEGVLLYHYQVMHERTNTLLMERLQLQKAAQALEAGVEHFDRGSNAEARGQGSERQGVDWAALARALQENLDSVVVENSKFGMRTCSMWTLGEFGKQVGMSVFQDAILLVHAFPYWPSGRMLLHELALQRGVPIIHKHLDISDEGAPGLEEAKDSSIPDLSERPYQPVSAKIVQEYLKWKLTLTDSEIIKLRMIERKYAK